MSYKYLLLRYPLLRSYISSCYERQAMDELFDFLFALELSDEKGGALYATPK